MMSKCQIHERKVGGPSLCLSPKWGGTIFECLSIGFFIRIMMKNQICSLQQIRTSINYIDKCALLSLSPWSLNQTLSAFGETHTHTRKCLISPESRMGETFFLCRLITSNIQPNPHQMIISLRPNVSACHAISQLRYFHHGFAYFPIYGKFPAFHPIYGNVTFRLCSWARSRQAPSSEWNFPGLNLTPMRADQRNMAAARLEGTDGKEFHRSANELLLLAAFLVTNEEKSMDVKRSKAHKDHLNQWSLESGDGKKSFTVIPEIRGVMQSWQIRTD